MKHVFKKEEDIFIKNNYKNMTYKEIANALNLTESQIKHRIQRHLNIKPSKRKKHFYHYLFSILDVYIEHLY